MKLDTSDYSVLIRGTRVAMALDIGACNLKTSGLAADTTRQLSYWLTENDKVPWKTTGSGGY